jgi:DNA-binding transcriptional LysR family regulator
LNKWQDGMAREINLNLLRVLVLLEKHRNLKQVGQVLGKTESAVSRYLTALREQLDEPLFIRSKQGLEPTHYTKQILPKIKLGLAQIDQSTTLSPFDPATYDGEINIALYAIALERYGERIYIALRQRFPCATISLLTWSQSTCERIIRGEIDLGLHMYAQDRPQMIHQIKIVEDDIVLIVDAKGKCPSWASVVNWPFVLIRSEGWNEYRQRGLELLKQHGVTLNIDVVVDNLSLGMALVRNNKFVSAIPRSCVTNDFDVIELPKHLKFYADLVICTKVTERANPLHKNLVEIFSQVILTV